MSLLRQNCTDELGQARSTKLYSGGETAVLSRKRMNFCGGCQQKCLARNETFRESVKENVDSAVNMRNIPASKRPTLAEGATWVFSSFPSLPRSAPPLSKGTFLYEATYHVARVVLNVGRLLAGPAVAAGADNVAPPIRGYCCRCLRSIGWQLPRAFQRQRSTG